MAIAATGGRVYRGTSAEERRADRRERLLRAAIAVYGKYGFRHATVNAVCQAAGLTPRYFYESFDSSEALLAASFQAVAVFVLNEMEAVDDEGADPLDRMREMLGALYAKLRDEPAAARVFLVEIIGVSPAVDAQFDRALARFGDLLLRTVRPGVPKGDNDVLLLAGVVGGMLHVARAWIIGGHCQPIKDVVDAAIPLCQLLMQPDGVG